MEKEKIYILQKDMPTCDAGMEFCLIEIKNRYQSMRMDKCSKWVYFPVDEVESNPTWFKLKEDRKLDVIEKHYTEKDLLEAEEKAFNAAKEHISFPFLNNKGALVKNLLTENYASFSDYKNGISQGSYISKKMDELLEEIRNDYKK